MRGRWRTRRLRRDFEEVLDVRALRRSGAVVRGDGWLGEVAIEWRPCPFGGLRAFWNCPRCGRVCELLFADTKEPACRVCQRVGYETTRMQPVDRLFAKRNAILDALGLPCPAPSWNDPRLKPPRMRFRTYECLLDQARRLEALALGAGLAQVKPSVDTGSLTVLSPGRVAP